MDNFLVSACSLLKSENGEYLSVDWSLRHGLSINEIPSHFTSYAPQKNISRKISPATQPNNCCHEFSFNVLSYLKSLKILTPIKILDFTILIVISSRWSDITPDVCSNLDKAGNTLEPIIIYFFQFIFFFATRNVVVACSHVKVFLMSGSKFFSPG